MSGQTDYQRDLLLNAFPQVPLNGRMVTLSDYPACKCGQGGLVQVGLEGREEPTIGGFIVADGVLVRTEHRERAEAFQGDTVLIREVGRRPCWDNALGPVDHVFYEWRWK